METYRVFCTLVGTFVYHDRMPASEFRANAAITTLSEDEMFIHVLALALRLGARGNICLDAIFIDEGSGSPDSDGDAGTLEQVLQPLQDLVGRSRAIGPHLARTARSTGFLD